MLCTLCGQPVNINKKRTIQQNRAYFGLVVKMIADHLGYDKEDMHKALAGEFLGYRSVKINDKVVQVSKSTKRLNTIEFNEYADRIRRWAAEQGFSIPEPQETPSFEQKGTSETLGEPWIIGGQSSS